MLKPSSAAYRVHAGSCGNVYHPITGTQVETTRVSDLSTARDSIGHAKLHRKPQPRSFITNVSRRIRNEVGLSVDDSDSLVNVE